MKILYLVHRVPYPPDKGDKIRSWNWLKGLAAQHEVHLVALYDDPDDLRHRHVLEEHCAEVALFPTAGFAGKIRTARALVSGASLSNAWFHSPAARSRLDTMMARTEFDVVLGFSAPMAHYLLDRERPPFVMDMVDVDSAKFADYGRRGSGWKARVYALEARRLARFEDRLARELDAVLLCTEPEADLLRARCPGAPIECLGNGAEIPEVTAEPARADDEIIFVGAMDYLANVDAVVFAAREIMPLLHRTHPRARFRIVGRHPTPEVRALADLPGVEVTGGVENIGDELRRAAFSMVPLRVAQGIQNKVLEALAHGLPVVTAPKIARSLDAGREQGVIVAEAAAEYAAAAAALLDDKEERARAGLAGREFVARTFAWSECVAKLEEILSRCVDAKGRARPISR